MREQAAKELAVSALELFRAFGIECLTGLARHGASEEAATHADAAMHAPGVHRQSGLVERLLPGEDVGIHRVDERSVEIEDQRSHITRDPSAAAR